MSRRPSRSTAGVKSAMPVQNNETVTDSMSKAANVSCSTTPASNSANPLDEEKAEHIAYDTEGNATKTIKIDSVLQEDKKLCEIIRSAIFGDLKDVGRKASSSALRVNVVSLRNVNRLLQLRLKLSRDAVAAARQSAENKHLALENLLYEVGHLERQISTCRLFRSRADEIPLVSSEEFYVSAPAAISRPLETRNNEHEQFKARLAWELEQRKTLADHLKAIESEIDVISDRINSKKVLLEAVRPRLKSVIEVSGGLNDVMKYGPKMCNVLAPLSCSSERKKAEIVARLPLSLHALYVKLSALMEVRGPEVGLNAVEILATELCAPQTIAARDDLSTPFEFSVVATIAVGCAIMRVSFTCFPDLENLLVAECKLSVIDGNGNGVSVPTKIVKLLENSYLLLFNLLPNQRKNSASVIVPLTIRRKLPAVLSPSAKLVISLAYPWLYTFTGALPCTIDPADQEQFLSSALSADHLVTALSSRATSRFALYRAFSELECGQLPISLATGDTLMAQMFRFPHNLCGNVRIGDLNYVGQLDGSTTAAELATANIEESSASIASFAKASVSDCMKKILVSTKERGFYFRLKLEKSKSLLIADIIIPAQFPRKWPLFTLSMHAADVHSKGDIPVLLEQMERIVNIDVGKKLASSLTSDDRVEGMSRLFAVQLCQLAACLDAAVPSMSKMRNHLHQTRGRERTRPWRYDQLKTEYDFSEEETLEFIGAGAGIDMVTKWNVDALGESDDNSSEDDLVSEKREDCRLVDERRSEQLEQTDIKDVWS